MDQIFSGLSFSWCYIIDVIIFSTTPQQRVRHLQTGSEWLQRWGLHLHHAKCKFFHDQLANMGHIIVPGVLRIQQAKVDALQKIPASVDVPRLCVFLGLTNYYS